MNLRVDAIYENGVLRPLGPVSLPDHARVRLTIDLAASNGKGLSACIGSLPADAAAEMTAIVESEFEKVDTRDW